MASRHKPFVIEAMVDGSWVDLDLAGGVTIKTAAGAAAYAVEFGTEGVRHRVMQLCEDGIVPVEVTTRKRARKEAT